MTVFNRVVLRASTTNLASEAIDTYGMDALFIQVSTTVTAATLATTTLTFGGGVAAIGSPGTVPVLDNALIVPISAAVTGISVPTGGVVTYTNPAIATHQTVYRIMNPPPVVIVSYAYGTGGGAVDIVVRAGGFRGSN